MFPFLLLLGKAIQIINAAERSLLRWRLPGWAPPTPQSGIFWGGKKKSEAPRGTLAIYTSNKYRSESRQDQPGLTATDI